MWKEIFLLAVLSYFSYTDAKTREINDYLVYATFLLGLLVNLGNLTGLLYSLGLTALVVGVLYLFGVFALGDLWVGLIIAAWLPENILSLPVAVIAVLGGAILGALYGIGLVVRNRWREWLDVTYKALLIGIPYSVNILAGLLVSCLLETGLPSTILLLLIPLALFDPARFLLVEGSFALFATLFFSLRHASELFTMEKTPEEGDIPAEIIDENGNKFPLGLKTMIKVKRGEIRPVHNLSADGLSKEDVERLRRVGIKKIRVKVSIPLVPFITLALLITLWLSTFP